MSALKITVTPPKGTAHYWERMRVRSKSGGFTIPQIHGDSNGVAQSGPRSFIIACLKAGYVEKIGHEGGTRGAAIYRVVKGAPVRTPVIQQGNDKYGTQETKRQQMWTAMRTLKTFKLQELAAAASTDTFPVTYPHAAAYVARLHKADVVTVTKGPNNVLTYRLKASANTGPQAPRLFRTTFVFDANKTRVLGETSTDEVLA